jgi:hypothetical protein
MKKRIGLFIILALLITTNLISQSAVELNKQGMKHYSNKNYIKAISKFRSAIKANSKYPWAHFNLACTLSLILPDFKTSYESEYLKVYPNADENIAYIRMLELEALSSLEKATMLNSEIKMKAYFDTDLSYLKNFFRFYKALGYSTNHYPDLVLILNNVRSWGVEGSGIIDPIISLVFNENLTFEMIYYEIDKNTTYKGRYNIIKQKNRLQIQFKFKNGIELKTYINENGSFQLQMGKILKLGGALDFFPNMEGWPGSA